MQARELAELAAVLAARGSTALRGSSRISVTAMEHYAATAQQRHRRWQQRLRLLHRAAAPVKSARAWLEEILVSEALARVWGAVLCTSVLPQEAAVISCATQAVRQHATARHRVMRLLAGAGLCLSRQDATELNQLRRSMARWIDLLVAHVQQNASACSTTGSHAQPADVCRFALEPQRAQEFAEDLGDQHAAGLGCSSLAMAIVSLRASLSQQVRGTSPNADLNHALATSIVACFAPDVFDATGPYRALWATRLAHRTADAERMIGQLLAE